jgi:hypothetical protein
MFRHVIMFRWKDDVTDEQKQALDGFAPLPAYIPDIRAWSFGNDIRLYPESYDFVIIADFDDVDAYLRYRDHPMHLKMIAQYVTPILAHYIRVQYETREQLSA